MLTDEKGGGNDYHSQRHPVQWSDTVVNAVFMPN